MKYSINRLKNDLEAVKGCILTNQGDIENYEGRIAAAAANILEYQSKVEELELAIEALKKHEVRQ